MKKDYYFVKKVVEFLETTQDKLKFQLTATLGKQFSSHFSTARLPSLGRFFRAFRSWCQAERNLTVDKENNKLFLEVVGEAQAHLEAHILQRYCHPTSPLRQTSTLNEDDLPEDLLFNYRFGEGKKDSLIASLLSTSPGVDGDFVLLRGDRTKGCIGSLYFTQEDIRYLHKDILALEALDKALTTGLMKLDERMVLIMKSRSSPESHVPMPGGSSPVPS